MCKVSGTRIISVCKNRLLYEFCNWQLYIEAKQAATLGSIHSKITCVRSSKTGDFCPQRQNWNSIMFDIIYGSFKDGFSFSVVDFHGAFYLQKEMQKALKGEGESMHFKSLLLKSIKSANIDELKANYKLCRNSVAEDESLLCGRHIGTVKLIGLHSHISCKSIIEHLRGNFIVIMYHPQSFNSSRCLCIITLLIQCLKLHLPGKIVVIFLNHCS